MYTIKEVAKRMDISEHTLRFWDKSGFFPFVIRDKNNVRNFSDNDLQWVYIVKCLKGTGAENKAIKRYIDLCIIGDSTIEERYEIIKSTRTKTVEKMKELITQMEVLEKKEAYYEAMIKNDCTDRCNPMNLQSDYNEFIKSRLVLK